MLTFVNKSITSLILQHVWSLKTPETFAKHFYIHMRYFRMSTEKLDINILKIVKCKFYACRKIFAFIPPPVN